MNITTPIAFIAGFFLGGNFGFIITCLVMAFRDDEEDRES